MWLRPLSNSQQGYSVREGRQMYEENSGGAFMWSKWVATPLDGEKRQR